MTEEKVRYEAGQNTSREAGQTGGIIPARSGESQMGSGGGDMLVTGFRQATIKSGLDCGQNIEQLSPLGAPVSVLRVCAYALSLGALEVRLFDGVGEISTARDDVQLEPGVWVLARFPYKALATSGALMRVEEGE